jgi:dTDP-4-amino-4,6-dideoxygalactose transaminase
VDDVAIESAPGREEREGSVRSTILSSGGAWTDHRERDQLDAVLSAGALSFGPRTAEFEQRFAALVGARHAVAVSSCWAGFHLMFETLDFRPGDEVLTSIAASTPAIAAVTHVGARPVMVDVDPVTLTLDVAEASRHVTPRTRAIMPGHFGGCPAAMDEVLALAAQHQLAVVEDATHALPAWDHGQMIGSMGLASVFSLSQDLNITTGEGGVVTTDRADLADLLRARRFYGVPAEWAPPVQFPGRARYEAAHTYGFGYQMADLNAAVGLGQLPKLKVFHAIRSYYAGLYELGLSDLESLILPRAPLGAQHAWVLYVVRLRPERLAISRDAFIERLAAQNVVGSVDFVPLYAHGYYGAQHGLRAARFPNARAAHETSVSLPLYPRMTEADVWDVIRSVRQIVGVDTTR